MGGEESMKGCASLEIAQHKSSSFRAQCVVYEVLPLPLERRARVMHVYLFVCLSVCLSTCEAQKLLHQLT